MVCRRFENAIPEPPYCVRNGSEREGVVQERVRKLRRREGAGGAGNPPGKDGDPAIRGDAGLRTGRENLHAIGAEALQLARATQNAKGQRPLLAGRKLRRHCGEMWNCGRLRDEYGKVAAPFPQAVSGINQRRKAVVESIFFHIELYVPPAANIPAPAGENEEQKRAQWCEARAGTARSGESRRDGEGTGDAGGGFDERDCSAPDREHGCADEVNSKLCERAGAP